MTVEGQSTTREAILTFLLREGNSSAGKLAKVMGISVQAMRRHLRSLDDDGLVESSAISKGPGRPLNLWQLTPEGHNSFNHANGSETFVLDLLASMDAKLSKERIAEILQQQTLEKAMNYRDKIGSGSLNLRLEKLVEL